MRSDTLYIWRAVRELFAQQAFEVLRNLVEWQIVLGIVPPAKQIIERAIFEHQHDDVLDALRWTIPDATGSLPYRPSPCMLRSNSPGASMDPNAQRYVAPLG
jgi:hypothetical protein